MDKNTLEYYIPIQDKESVIKYNNILREMRGDNFEPCKPTEDHIEILMKKIYSTIHNVGNDGGWYLGDDIRVKVEVEYIPESK